MNHKDYDNWKLATPCDDHSNDDMWEDQLDLVFEGPSHDLDRFMNELTSLAKELADKHRIYVKKDLTK